MQFPPHKPPQNPSLHLMRERPKEQNAKTQTKQKTTAEKSRLLFFILYIVTLALHFAIYFFGITDGRHSVGGVGVGADLVGIFAV